MLSMSGTILSATSMLSMALRTFGMHTDRGTVCMLKMSAATPKALICMALHVNRKDGLPEITFEVYEEAVL